MKIKQEEEEPTNEVKNEDDEIIDLSIAEVHSIKVEDGQRALSSKSLFSKSSSSINGGNSASNNATLVHTWNGSSDLQDFTDNNYK